MKNRVIVFCVLFATFAVNLAAKSKYIDIPGNSEVTVVGKVNFSSDVDKEFLFNTFKIPEDKRNYPDLYVLPYIPGSAGLFTNVHKAHETGGFDNQAWSVNGNYFFVKYKLLKDRTLYFSNIVIFIGASYQLPVILPLNFKVTVPENEKFIYLGDFNFTAKGFAFELSSSVKDNYDSAQNALNEVTKKEYRLCRANLEPITEEDLDAINKTFYYESVTTNFSLWYQRLEYLGLIAKEGTVN